MQKIAMDDLPPGAAATFATLAPVLRNTKDDWWLIGGSAVLLHGGAMDRLADIDILLSQEDARRILDDHHLEAIEDGGTERFRSDIYCRWEALDVPIDIMAGFSVHKNTGWVSVEPKTREPIQVGEMVFFVPGIAEMIEMHQLFGRPKDRLREVELRALSLEIGRSQPGYR